jgi:hypothetical protein
MSGIATNQQAAVSARAVRLRGPARSLYELAMKIVQQKGL